MANEETAGTGTLEKIINEVARGLAEAAKRLEKKSEAQGREGA